MRQQGTLEADSKIYLCVAHIHTRERHKRKTLSSKHMPDRLELTGAEVKEGERYREIALEEEAVGRVHVEVFL